jgi:cobalt-zinc-cadmium efflux system protein
MAAVGVNLVFTLVELVGGVAAGSLALLSDALHNFSDCGSLLVTWVTRRIARRRADCRRTFGYRRAEVVGSLVNLTALLLICLYLVSEAAWRLFQPREVQGRIVLAVAAVALLVDLGTVLILQATSRRSLNVRAALLHNLSDAIASLGVIVAGLLVVISQLHLADAVVSLLIAGYILWQSLPMMSRCIAILMDSVPPDVDVDALVQELEAVDGVLGVHHLHVWQLNEEDGALEAHVVVDAQTAHDLEQLKYALKKRLAESFRITHSTLEFELLSEERGPLEHDTSLIPDH